MGGAAVAGRLDTMLLTSPAVAAQGIGPATASAVLAAHCLELPFMSDEAMVC